MGGTIEYDPAKEERAQLEARALKAEAQVAALREALQRIRRTPSKPFPDGGAHSWQAYSAAVYSAWGMIQLVADQALRETE